LREGLKLARKLGQTQPLNASILSEVSPGASVVSDADWDAWIPGTVGTEFHPSCTCAMLPLSQGGVVDPNLKVYGTANVRVVDASVYPIQFAAHLQAPTYGLAGLAASI
ncbi:glucose-methanol-choline oxidoreductase, partial [Hysterangium stoloniferum]